MSPFTTAVPTPPKPGPALFPPPPMAAPEIEPQPVASEAVAEVETPAEPVPTARTRRRPRTRRARTAPPTAHRDTLGFVIDELERLEMQATKQQVEISALRSVIVFFAARDDQEAAR